MQWSEGLSAGASIATGLSEIKDVKRFSAEKSFLNRHHGKFDKVKPFFSAISKVFSLFGVMGNSPELQRIQNLNKVISKGFVRLETTIDRIKNSLDGLEDEIKRQHFWTRLDPELKKLYQVTERGLYYELQMEGETAADRLASFKNEYNEMYDAFLAIKGTFEGKTGRKTLCDNLIEISNTDLHRVLIVTYILFDHLFQAAINLVKIKAVVNKNISDSEMEKFVNEMAKAIKGTKTIIDECETKIRSKSWKLRWKTDVIEHLDETNVDDTISKLAK